MSCGTIRLLARSLAFDLIKRIVVFNPDTDARAIMLESGSFEVPVLADQTKVGR